MLRKRLPSVLLTITLLLAGGVAHAQTNVPLRAGSEIESTIRKGEVRNFTFEMGDNQVAELIFEWQGIDLLVSVYDSSGKPLLRPPIPVTAPGPVSVLLKLEKSQSYRVDVTTSVPQNISGSYRLLLKTKPVVSLNDESRLEAQNLILAARSGNPQSVQIEKYQQALVQARNADHLDTQAQIFLMIGNAYRSAREIKLADENYKNALNLWKQKNDLRGEAYANVRLGLLYLQRDPATALPFYTEAARLFEQVNDRRGRGEALYGQGFAVLRVGPTPEAIEILTKALEVRRVEGDRLGEANTLNVLGDAYRMTGDFDKALKFLDEASQASAGLEHPTLEAAIANGKALVNDDLSQWESAKNAYLNVLSSYDRILKAPIATACYTMPAPENQSNCRNAAVVLINVGETYNSLGNPADALIEFKKSLTIGDAVADPTIQADALMRIGYSYYLLGEIAVALTHLEKALTLQRAANNQKGIAAVLTYIGMAYMAHREPKVALEKYQAALPVVEKAGEKRLLAILLDKLGSSHSSLGQRNEAAVVHQRSLDVWRQIKDPDGEALTLYHMAEAERAAGNLVAAIKHSEAAIKLVESLRTRIANEKFRVSYLADKKGYYELDIDLRMQHGRATSDNSAIAAALQSNEKARARALLDALQDAVSKQANANEERKVTALFKRREDSVILLGVRAKQRTELLGGDNKPSKELLALDSEIDKLTEQLADIDAQIRSENPRLAELTRPQPATVREIQQQLDPDTLMLEFALGEKRSYAWTVTTKGVQAYELPPRNQIEDAATRLLSALNAQKRLEGDETALQQKTRLANAEKEFAAAAALLKRMVLDPVAQQLDHTRLVIVADGALQLVPFAVLPDPKNSAATLISNYEIVSLPSASVLALQRRELANRKQAPLSVAIVADPVFDHDDERMAKLMSRAKRSKPKETKSLAAQAPNAADKRFSDVKGDGALHGALRDVGLDPNALGRLRKSGEEAAEISSVVSRSKSFTAMGFQASREMVMSGKLGKYRNVHFATHGLMDLEHPELSGIVLSQFDEKGRPQDGYLRLYEIYTLDLPAELVVLSACQTGSGKQVRGEGLMALTRGFMYAGAARVVSTLWKVDDAATADLMPLFYKEMFTNGKRPAAALRDAQIELSKQKRWSSPYYWGGFVLQGEWR